MNDYVSLHLGDCLDVLRGIPAESVDALVTDPPAGIGFMGRAWDTFGRSNPAAQEDREVAYDRYGKGALPYGFSGASRTSGDRERFIIFLTAVAEECLRVMKPGAHGLVWALPRTSHWTATALEDVGFEVRDSITHHFGSGFPKSLDVSKAIDKAAGAEREVVGSKIGVPGYSLVPNKGHLYGGGFGGDPASDPVREAEISAPATEAAKRWQGWGTALKPATEVWWLIRKPLDASNVASNVLTHGTGALNVDATRVEGMPRLTGTRNPHAKSGVNGIYGSDHRTDRQQRYDANPPAGRWPANLVLSHSEGCDGECAEDCPVAELDRQSGELVSGSAHVLRRGSTTGKSMGYGSSAAGEAADATYGDSGGASRFFSTFRYEPKASTAERNQGLTEAYLNKHPTVKPVDLMRWLCRLITPPGGTVLDPFMGSGSTGVAAKLEGFRFIGIEKDVESYETARKRLEWAVHEPGLFDEEVIG